MAMKPFRPCLHPGCSALTRDGYCPAHKPKTVRSADSAAWHRLYALPIWTDVLRPWQLLLEPLCRDCARRGIRTSATDVDHVVEHQGDWALFSDPGNLQSLCHSCHSRKTALEQAMARKNQQKKKASGGETLRLRPDVQASLPASAPPVCAGKSLWLSTPPRHR